MRQNLPVSQQEYDFPATATLMSTTDTQSHVTYANAAFLAASGFDRDEILGQPHNLVRHPDMPPQAFADMWSTLKSGLSWTALVKNRRKNGDHYWVRANATPVVRQGQLTGYMSVRTKPSRDEVADAERVYRAFREGRMKGRRFHRGMVVRKGLLAWMSWPQTMPLRWRLRCVVLGLLLPIVAVAGAFGLAGETLAGFAVSCMAMAALASLMLEQQVSRPLGVVLKQALCVAAGQSADKVALNRVDEVGMILRAVNQSGLNLRALLDDVDEQVGEVRTASSEIAQGNQDLSSRTEHAASSLQETAASMEQIASTVQNNAATAREATGLANSASDAAARGGSIVSRVVGTMQDISTSSRKIADIIGVIDGIAFQTNILALNAAVEAARAGEQGRGFSVVAGEVRSLAQRSSEAAREIKSLITASVDRIEDGARRADDAGAAMAEIVGQVERMSGLFNEISNASLEQASGIGQVNAAVAQLDQVTQQNAALVEQSAAAAEAMKQRAVHLASAVRAFMH